VLLDVADYQLDFKIVGALLGNLVQPVKNRFQLGQFGHTVDLLVQAF
jgi:hypothetical protein